MKKSLLAISLITISCLYGVLAAVIILIFLLTGSSVSIGILISLAIIIIQFLVAPSLNDWIYKSFYKTTFNVQLPEYLNDFITESCNRHNMNYPKIGLINDGTPNAFTYGRTKNDARIILTRGVLEMLTPDEVKAVVAHELGHANHYDMIFMTAAQIIPLVLYYIVDVFLNVSARRSSRNSKNNNSQSVVAMIGLIAYILYIISQYIILWLSRTREYYADSFSIEETQNPSSLASALVKIGFGLSLGNKEDKSVVTTSNALGINNAKISKGIAISAYNNGGVSKENIINAMKWEKWNIWAKVNELNSTHPLISKRLLAISERCEEFGQPKYIIFDEKKPESYVDDFIKDIVIVSLPTVILIATLILLVVFIDQPLVVAGIGGILFTLSLFLSLNHTHKNKDYKETTVSELLSEVKVSNVTSIPCILKGRIIGRGNPGCIFNEDFVIQDNTGIMFLNYTQPLITLEKLFAIFKLEQNFNKEVTVKGWYRRSTVPYVEIYSYVVDGKEKKCHTYKTTKIFYGILLILSIIALIYVFI